MYAGPVVEAKGIRMQIAEIARLVSTLKDSGYRC